jgi:phenylacetate-CoA ligase
MSDEVGLLAALVGQLEQSQWMVGEELARLQHLQLVAVAHHAMAHSPMFRDRLQRAGLRPEDLGTADGLSRLPPLGRRDLQRAGADALCVEVPLMHLPLSKYSSSGSTGEPVSVQRTELNRIDWQALTMRVHRWHGSEPAMRFCALRAKLPGVAERPDWGFPAAHFLRTGAMLGIPNNLAITRQAELIAAFRPDILLLYPSNLDGLIRHIEAGGSRFDLRVIRTIGETLPEPLRAEAEALWGCRVFDCYSSEEVGYVALQCPDGEGYHLMSEMLLVEVIGPDGRACAPGEIGRVLVTDLRNFATPLVRYELGDLAEVGEPCACGRGLPTIRRVMGRERNLILMPDGSRHWPLTGRSQYRSVAPVAQYQMIQHERERIEVRLVVDTPLTVDQEAALKAMMLKALGYPFALDFTYFEGTLPRGANGKLEEFVCRV